MLTVVGYPMIPRAAPSHTPHEPSAATGFAGSRIDRQSETRGETAVADARAHPDARLYLMRDDRAFLKATGNGFDPLFIGDEPIFAEIVPDSTLLLGYVGEAPRLAARVCDDVEPGDNIKAIDLRSIVYQGLLSGEDTGALAQARSLLSWHQRHGFCANCGAQTTTALGGYRRDCPSCAATHFPRTDPVVIMLVADGDRALLGRSHRFNDGMYSCLAGFVEPGETIEAAVRRETFEEAGVEIGPVHYHASQPWPFPSSLMIGCLADAISTEITIDANELESARWFPRSELARMLAGTHMDGLTCPPPLAIAHHLIKAFVEG